MTKCDWSAGAELLANLFPRERLEPAVVAWADSASRRQIWSVAFSGGPDSLAVLLLLWAHWPARRASLRALHFDHGMRGRESRADASYCRRVCDALKVKMVIGRWPGNHRGASEAEARTARMAFFAQHARVVWLGHQQDDIAESMLMRLARGSGAGGLSAPRPIQRLNAGRFHLRPLLTLKKKEIVAALAQAKLVWREDSTNARGDYFRNRIRRDVLPAWADAAERDALAGAARSRLLLEEDDAALDRWVDEIAPLESDGRLILSRLAAKPRAVVRRALHRWLAAKVPRGDLSRQAFDLLLEAVVRGAPTRQSMGPNGFAVIARGELIFEQIGRRMVNSTGAAN